MKALAAVAAAACLVLAPAVRAEVVQQRGVRVAVTGELAPDALPRRAPAPVSVSLGGRISATSPDGPPQLRSIAIAINSHGHLRLNRVPRCRLGSIDPSTTAEARAACRTSLVGEGSFSATVKLPEQSPFPSRGKVLAFNGKLLGRPVIFAHIYGAKPVPTSYVLPFIVKSGRGTYGTILEAALPEATGDWGYVTGVSLRLNGSARGSRDYLTAACPAPEGLNLALFPFMRTSFVFAGGPTLTSTLTETCKVKR